MSEKNSGKKLTMEQLVGTVRTMVQEELKAAREASRPAKVAEAVLPAELDKDDINPLFARMRPADRAAMVQWIMRYYFSPAKKDQPWWNKKITPANVLAYISNLKSDFPLSPKEMVDDWNIKKSLKSDLAAVEDKDIEAFEKNEPVGPQNASGEKTLKDIAKELGGISIPMARNIEIGGLEKLKKLLGGKNFLHMDEDELDELLQSADKARDEVSLTFAKELKAAGGDIRKFLKGLVAKNTITAVDVKLLSPKEIEMLVYLMDKPEAQVAEYLRGDSRKSDNKIKTFQAAVARALSPVRPRGRPRKNP